MDRDRMRTAFHEAIHASGAFLLNVPIENVCIEYKQETKKWDGEVNFIQGQIFLPEYIVISMLPLCINHKWTTPITPEEHEEESRSGITHFIRIGKNLDNQYISPDHV